MMVHAVSQRTSCQKRNKSTANQSMSRDKRPTQVGVRHYPCRFQNIHLHTWYSKVINVQVPTKLSGINHFGRCRRSPSHLHQVRVRCPRIFPLSSGQLVALSSMPTSCPCSIWKTYRSEAMVLCRETVAQPCITFLVTS